MFKSFQSFDSSCTWFFMADFEFANKMMFISKWVVLTLFNAVIMLVKFLCYPSTEFNFQLLNSDTVKGIRYLIMAQKIGNFTS